MTPQERFDFHKKESGVLTMVITADDNTEFRMYRPSPALLPGYCWHKGAMWSNDCIVDDVVLYGDGSVEVEFEDYTTTQRGRAEIERNEMYRDGWFDDPRIFSPEVALAMDADRLKFLATPCSQ